MCKKVLCGFLFIALFLLFAIVPSAAQQSKVRPTVWHVDPAMNRLQIQAVVDSASNGDTVYFHTGTYDWSDAPIYPRYANEGAINIIDKTLTIKGEPGNLIKGPDSVGTGLDQRGIHAFHVLDEDTDNDATFVGLNIQHFMRGVVAFHNFGALPDSPEYTIPNARNVTVKNCAITDIARQGIIVDDATGNISIEHNTLSQCAVEGIWVSYSGPDGTYWQPDKSTVNVSGNKITSSSLAGIYAGRTKNFQVENNSISMLGPSIGTHGICIEGAKKGTVVFANPITNYQFGILGAGWSSPPNNYDSENMIIDKNKVSCISPDWCYGIILDYDLSSGHTVTRNEINLTSTRGVGIYSEVNHSFYEKNKISGSGRAAVYLSGWDYPGGTGLPTYAHHELFQGNDVSKFTPSEAHYFLEYGTHENQIFGFGRSPWTHKDYGINNLIIGGTNITNATVQALGVFSEVGKKHLNEFREARKNILF